jgi:hypothetical protein
MEDFTAKFKESLMENLFSTSLVEVAINVGNGELMFKLIDNRYTICDIQIYQRILLVYTTDSNMMNDE